MGAELMGADFTDANLERCT
ncbi:MAG: hypothetical protein IPI35_07915 [Deltaproteobacteria bacterium]|nr:hypothetical protein [Deltaproteobacteria bacterium]